MEASRRTPRANSQARQLFLSASLADQSHGATWQAWARFEEAQGDADLARKLYGKGAEMAPGHAPLWQVWTTFVKIGSIWPNFPKISLNLPNFFIFFNLFSLLLQKFNEFYWNYAPISPNFPQISKSWARLEESGGNFERSRELYRKSLEVDQGHAHAWLVRTFFVLFLVFGKICVLFL